MDNKKFELFRLFSTPVLKGKLDLDSKELVKVRNYIKKEKYIPSGTNKPTYQSENMYVLDNLPFLKQKILNTLKIYKNGVYKFNNTNITMTTSWGVKVEPESESIYHNHSNSLFSGVYYVDTDNKTSDISFNSFPIHKVISPSTLDPTESTIDNSHIWSFKPENNMIIFFPSYLYHKIEKNFSKKTRYSIAFNFMPYGKTGNSDSILNLENNYK